MNKSILFLLIVIVAATAPFIRADEPEMEAAPPRAVAIAVTFVNKEKTSLDLEASLVAKLHKTLAEKDTLFVKADLSTKASSNQARLLLQALGAGTIWEAYRAKPGTLVLLDLTGDLVREFTPKSKAADVEAEIEKLRKSTDDVDVEDEAEPEDGCGCGCDDGDTDGCDDGEGDGGDRR